MPLPGLPQKHGSCANSHFYKTTNLGVATMSLMSLHLKNPTNTTPPTPAEDNDVQESITTFWTTVAPFYNSDPSNVPNLASPEYEAWIRAIERLLPAPPADVLD